MKIAIVTLSLLNNYGGVIQNFALQRVLDKMQVESKTIDYLKIPASPFYRYVISWIKAAILLFTSKRRKFARYTHKGSRSKKIQDFIDEHICITEKCYRYTTDLIEGFDAVIVGSDQVWRPMFNYKIEERFLSFAKDYSIKRIAYAASFGVDNWECSPKQTRVCSELAKKFDAISVREESGVKLCKEYLGVNATWVLDPTLLLAKEDYLPICEEVPVCTEKYLAVYVLDENEKLISTYEKEAKARGLIVKKFYADSKSTLTVPEWIAMFRDASYVVTDSFHGTVFSIIFGKEFKCLYNKTRGSARFDSLLKLYESGKLDEMRTFSMNWLRMALGK